MKRETKIHPTGDHLEVLIDGVKIGGHSLTDDTWAFTFCPECQTEVRVRSAQQAGVCDTLECEYDAAHHFEGLSVEGCDEPA